MTSHSPDFGPLVKTLRKFMNLDNALDDFAKLEAEGYLQRVQDAIDDQTFDWVPLSPNYKKRKIQLGQNPNVWIASSTLRRQIKVIRAAPGSYYLGGELNEMHDPSDLLLNNLIAIQEFGNVPRNIPARPLFRPARDQQANRVNARLLSYLAAHVIPPKFRKLLFPSLVTHLSPDKEPRKQKFTASRNVKPKDKPDDGSNPSTN